MKKDFDDLPALEKIFIFEKGALAYVDRTRYVPEVYRFCPEPVAPTLMDEAGAEPTDDVGEVIVRQVLCARYHADSGIRQFYFVVKDGVMPDGATFDKVFGVGDWKR